MLAIYKVSQNNIDFSIGNIFVTNGYCVFIIKRIILKLDMEIDHIITSQFTQERHIIQSVVLLIPCDISTYGYKCLDVL